MIFKKAINLLRVRQWYKNLVIFIAILFGLQLFNVLSITKIFLGFVSLCFISSVNYIINDIADKKKDIENPEKRNRPIASGEIKLWQAILVAIILFLGSFSIAFLLSKNFLYFILILFILGLIYSLWAKNKLFLDVLIIAINFVIRALSGVIILNLPISNWLITCTFFLSLLLSVGKRKAESSFLKEGASEHRRVMGAYSKEIINMLIIISASCLIMSYAIYSFSGKYIYMIITLPIAFYLVLRYISLIYSDSIIARHPEKIFTDKKMILGILFWIILVIIIIYSGIL